MIRCALLAVLCLGFGLLTPASGEPTGEARAALELRDSGGVTTQGTVTRLEDVEKSRSTGTRRSRRMETYVARCPVYTYRTEDGSRREYASRTYGCDEAAVGDTVELIYDPARPYDVAVNDDAYLEDAEDAAARQPLIRYASFAGAALFGLLALWLMVGRLRRRARG